MADARMSFIPIIPTGPVSNFSRARLVGRMSQLGLDIVRRAANYPASKTSYRRTGELGRRWTKRGPNLSGGGLAVEVGNNLRYASRVMGFEKDQLPLFQGLGWVSITKIGQEEVDRARPSIQRAIQGL